jgi:outer membrane protein assembly factor BamB
LELGTDLSSDICGVAIDDKNIYACIRNGPITVIDIKNMKIKGNYKISNGSFWDLHIHNDYIIGGNVNGELMLINKKNMKIKKRIVLNNQNIHNIVVDNNLVYAAGQNKTIYTIDVNQFSCINQKRNAHKMMFDCAGVYKKNLITISYPCSELSFWDKETLEHKKTINIPLRLFGRTFIEKNKLYISSKNIMGIIKCNLE